jgi:hypothetical protein
MNMNMRTLILGAAIGIAPTVTTISPTQAGMIGPGKLQITEPASLVEAVRSRMGSVSAGSTVRSGSVAAQGGTRVWPGRNIYVDSRALNLKAVQVPRGRYCHHGGCQK